MDLDKFIHFKFYDFHVWRKEVGNIKTEMFEMLKKMMPWKYDPVSDSHKVKMCSYGGIMLYDSHPMTNILNWKNLFAELCKLIGYKFNSFLLNYYKEGK